MTKEETEVEEKSFIPRKFNISGGVKRKALLAVPTICRYCGRPFLDKVYDVGRHKVICPNCHKVNAETDFPTMEKIRQMALDYDLGTAGQLGGFSRGTDIRDIKEHAEAEKKAELADYLTQIRESTKRYIKKPKKEKDGNRRSDK